MSSTKPKSYQSLEQEALYQKSTGNATNKKCDTKMLCYSLIVTLIALVGLLSFTIYYVIHSESSTGSDDDICYTPQCIKASHDILSYFDESIDPCYDFWGYVCGGFQSMHSSQIAEFGEHQYGTEEYMQKIQENKFLEAIFSDKFANESSAQKLKIFYDSCYISNVEQEQFDLNVILNEYISNINFIEDINNMNNLNTINWTENEINGFQNSIIWLLQMGSGW
eukprot:472408_1